MSLITILKNLRCKKVEQVKASKLRGIKGIRGYYHATYCEVRKSRREGMWALCSQNIRPFEMIYDPDMAFMLINCPRCRKKLE